ncbi:MAG TPA: PAC2 family protein [Candidatus Caenarcaniphilales bacterium]|nr:PAC2 family protein [Candidatus Caenarcaniphilales bacterium]
MSLVRLTGAADLISPTVVVAFDAWVDAGSASSTAAQQLADRGSMLASFDADVLYDYRARRPTLDIIDGRPASLDWPELTLRRTRLAERDVLVLSGPEPDFRWRELASELASLARHLEVDQWISLGAIPAAVPHTRPVPVLGTESSPGLLRGGVRPGPDGLLRVPSAALSVLDITVAEAGIPAIGYFAQIPHYVSGQYPAAAVELLRAIEAHLGVDISVRTLQDEADQMRIRLDTATALDEKTRAYVTRLEGMVDEARLPSGDELITEIERFLRERGTEPGGGRIH